MDWRICLLWYSPPFSNASGKNVLGGYAVVDGAVLAPGEKSPGKDPREGGAQRL
jgi:hypothetical protein